MNIKIYINCEKNCIYPQDDILTSIQVGATAAEETLSMQLDNIGENISNKYFRYQILTSQYWAMKNTDHDYIGFMNANCYFNFKDNKQEQKQAIIQKYLYEESFSAYGIDGKNILEQINGYDLIVPQRTNLKNTIYNTFINKVVFTNIIPGGGYKRDLDFCISYIQKYYPQIYPYAKKYLNQKQNYFHDIFIMKNTYFSQYTNFLFDILFAHERECDCSLYGIKPIQISYELSNCLGGIYLYYLLQTNKNLSIKYLSTIYFENIDKEEEYFPAFQENNIAILLAPNETYLPHAAVLIQSIIENSSKENNYDIILFKTDIVERTKKLVLKQIENYPNFSIRFFDIGRYIYQYANLPTIDHFTIEMYFRIFAPYILKNYDKILYLDSDTIVLKDIAELYKTNIDNYLLAACHDLMSYGSINCIYTRYNDLQKVKLNHPYTYYNSGVLLLNVVKFRKQFILEQIMKILQENNFHYPDQDILNYLTKNQTYFLDPRWNIYRDAWSTIENELIYAPIEYYNLMLATYKNPYIIHYISSIKPWNNLNNDFAEIYWYYARKTDFYEIIIYKEIERAKNDVIIMTKPENKLKKVVKKILMPLVNCFFPKNTKRREKLKKLFAK